MTELPNEIWARAAMDGDVGGDWWDERENGLTRYIRADPIATEAGELLKRTSFLESQHAVFDFLTRIARGGATP